jgi:hypothetical protein
MRCRGCDTSILSHQALHGDGLCKKCQKLGVFTSPISPVVPSPAPHKETVMAEPKSAPVAELNTPPEGFRYVYNRTNDHYELMFNGVPICFDAHQIRLLRCEVAEFVHAHSIIPGTLHNTKGTLKGERALALGPGYTIRMWVKTADATGAGNDVYLPEYTEAEADALFRVPTDTKPGVTLFDLERTPNYADRPSREGQATRPQLIPV